MNHNMNHIKHKIARWLLKDEVEKIKIERETFQVVSKSMEEDKETYREWASKRTVTDMVRERLAGFDFKENEKDLVSSIPKDRVMEFLEEAVTIKEGDVFSFLTDYLTRQQAEYTLTGADTMDRINFGRATLNGIALMEEGVDSLFSEYERRTEEKENYDEYSAT